MHDEKDTINLSSVNTPKKTPRKLTLPKLSRKPHGPHRDDEGKFATKSTTGSGGLTAAKQFNWKRAAPLMAIITIVGGLFVYQSFAGSFGLRSSGKSGKISKLQATETGICKKAGIHSDIAGSKSLVTNGDWIKKAYQKIYGVDPETSEIFRWYDRASVIDQEYRAKNDTVGYTCRVAPDIYKEIETAKADGEQAKRLTQPVIQDKDIPADGPAIVKTIYAKDMLQYKRNPNGSSQWVHLKPVPLQQTLGAMNGSMQDEDYEIRRQYSYENETVVEETPLGGNYLYELIYKDYGNGREYRDEQIYRYDWEAHWGEKVKACALIYNANPPGENKDGKRDPGYPDVSIKIGSARHGSGSFEMHRLVDLKDYNADKGGYFLNSGHNSWVEPFEKFYICSKTVPKPPQSSRDGRYVISPELIPRLPVLTQSQKSKFPRLMIERIDIVQVP